MTKHTLINGLSHTWANPFSVAWSTHLRQASLNREISVRVDNPVAAAQIPACLCLPVIVCCFSLVFRKFFNTIHITGIPYTKKNENKCWRNGNKSLVHKKLTLFSQSYIFFIIREPPMTKWKFGCVKHGTFSIWEFFFLGGGGGSEKVDLGSLKELFLQCVFTLLFFT